MRRRLESFCTSIAAILLWVGWAAPASAQDEPTQVVAPGISVSLQGELPETSPVGQVVTLTFEITHPQSVKVSPPDSTGTSRILLSQAELTRQTSPEQASQVSRLVLSVLPLRSGTASLNGLTLSLIDEDGEPKTKPLLQGQIKFISSLDGEVSSLKKPLPPQVIKQEDYTPIKWGAGLLGAALLLGLIALAVRAAKPEPAPPAPPAIDDVARDALRALEQEPLEHDAQIVAFYTSMSEILRDYLGKRYGFPGTEYTTTEILESLPVSLLPPALGLSDIAQWLRQSDRVKFSTRRPPQDASFADLRQAIAMVDLTRPPAQREEVEQSGEDHEVDEVPQVKEEVPEPMIEPVVHAESEPIEHIDEVTSEDPKEPEEPSALDGFSWDELSEMVDELHESGEEE